MISAPGQTVHFPTGPAVASFDTRSNRTPDGVCHEKRRTLQGSIREASPQIDLLTIYQPPFRFEHACDRNCAKMIGPVALPSTNDRPVLGRE